MPLRFPPAQGMTATGLDLSPGAASVFARNGLLLTVNAKRDFGASGSNQTTTGTIAAGSDQLILAAALDFVNGQGISIANAGPLPTITAPTAATATPEGTAGTTTYDYAVAALDGKGGVTASFAFSTTTGNATLSATNYNALSVTAVSGAAGYAWYKTGVGLIAVTSITSVDDTGLGAFGPPIGVPSVAPVSAVGDFLVTTIVSGAGTTTLTLGATATEAVNGSAVWHDDTLAIYNAVNSGASAVIIPPGNYVITSTSAVPDNVTVNLAGVLIPHFSGLTGNFLRANNGASAGGVNFTGEGRLASGHGGFFLLDPAVGTTPVADITSLLQDALTQMGTAGGGIVMLTTGYWVISSNVTIPSGVTLMGASAFSESSSTQDSTHMVVGNNSIILSGDYPGIDKVYIDGSGGTNGTCLVIAAGSRYPKIGDIRINAASGGMGLAANGTTGQEVIEGRIGSVTVFGGYTNFRFVCCSMFVIDKLDSIAAHANDVVFTGDGGSGFTDGFQIAQLQTTSQQGSSGVQVKVGESTTAKACGIHITDLETNGPTGWTPIEFNCPAVTGEDSSILNWYNQSAVHGPSALVFNNASAGSLVVNNIIDADNWTGLTSPAVPASGTAVQNPFGVACTVAVTDSGTGTSIAVGGITVATVAAGATIPIRVGARQSITLTYTTAPTWAWAIE